MQRWSKIAAAVAALLATLSGALLMTASAAQTTDRTPERGSPDARATVIVTENYCQSYEMITLVRVWDRKHFEGTPKNFCGYEKCSESYGDIDLAWYRLSEWSNRISSVKTYNRCDIRLWDGPYLNDGHSTWIDQKGDLAKVGSGWNNRASSFQLT